MSGTEHSFWQSTDILATIPQYPTLLLALILPWLLYLISKRRNSRHQLTPSDDHDEDALNTKLAQYQPEPLVTPVPKDHASLNPKRVTSAIGKEVEVEGKKRLNLASHNYLGLTEDEQMKDKAIETIRKYGVGSCGPRGFYGTVDVHLELEQRLADFMRTQQAIIYSYGFSTIASAIPAYCKRKDVVFVDEKVNFSIQKGLDVTRSTILYFKHNDVQDLERLILEQNGLGKKNSKGVELTRKFLIVEGIYANTGCICRLPELLELCARYKLRIFVDESVSFGVLGENGRGVTEHFNVPIKKVDMIMGSLENAIGSIGGFCVGSSFIIEHQRLSGLGYCFSASLPPLLASAAITALDLMCQKREIFERLRANCRQLDAGIRGIEALECASAVESPVKYICFKGVDWEKEKILLQNLCLDCFEDGVTVIIPAFLEEDRDYPRHSLRLCVSAVLSEEEIEFVVGVMRKNVERILERLAHLLKKE